MDATVQVKTPPSRHYFYRKATQPDQTTSSNGNIMLNSVESTNIFEKRIEDFINKRSIQLAIDNLRQDATHDLNRRKADRKARKEKEEQSNNSSVAQDTSNTNDPVKQEEHEDKTPTPLFEKLNSLSANEQNAWLSNIHDNALLVNPHQWLKLASLFNVNSKVARQQTLLNIASLDAVLEDRSISREDVKPLENYLELRDIQNRNYARDAVIEGVKHFKQNKIKEAMEFYKRALDMDPKYADGWFHVAECLVQQRKLTDAASQLERVLKLEPGHEEAKSLLININHTINPKKPTKGDEWDMVDEFGESMEKAVDKDNDSEDESRSRRRKKKSSRRSRSRERRRHRSRDRRRSKSPRDTHRDRRRSKSPRDNKKRARSESPKESHRDKRHSRSRSSSAHRDKRRSRSRDRKRSKSPRDYHRSRRSYSRRDHDDKRESRRRSRSPRKEGDSKRNRDYSREKRHHNDSNSKDRHSSKDSLHTNRRKN